ncbi:hypothetical protein MAP00_004330 [Monascus purpureus]|nr:hypothetical protein MAP00_004330 [Monascus purpureus]
MIQDVPNLAFIIGYTARTWTLGADVMAFTLCWLLRHMEKRGKAVPMPHMTYADTEGHVDGSNGSAPS